MLTEICQYLRNWFARDKLLGDFVISGGELTYSDGTALSLLYGQYFRIIGSVFNDGVHKWGDEEDALTDETAFDGAVWPMAVPPGMIALDAEITAWQEKNGSLDSYNMSPFQSESAFGYSYAKKYAGGSAQQCVTWQSQFAARLAPWRKI